MIHIPHPGHWLHFIKRNDNRGLSIELIRQKYVKEQFLFEQYMGFIQYQKVLGGGGVEHSTTQSSYLLQEDGGFLLQENSFKIIIE
jgi:hypothetical protein